jgi:hypothetical protein
MANELHRFAIPTNAIVTELIGLQIILDGN